MSVDTATTGLPPLGHAYAAELPELVTPWRAASFPSPRIVALADDIAVELGLAPDWLRTPEGTAALLHGDGDTVAMGYAGHQFGGYSPRLGDGRALLLGELTHPVTGARLDLHLKGSGRTPYARGGDGRAALGPMLREFVVAEAMHALGIPTTRSLAVIETGEAVMRDRGPERGGVLVRVAASHVRVGTFEYAARLAPPESGLVRRLADHAIARHHPGAADAEQPYLALLAAVVDAQAALVADWMAVGFVHGVMNTDNTTISGESIDYGPCAFVDVYDHEATFSSIDTQGRYALGHQPPIAQWNLSRFAETLLPLIAPDDPASAVEPATAEIARFPAAYAQAWRTRTAAKLGLDAADLVADETLASDLLGHLQAQQADHTLAFRGLAAWLRDGSRGEGPLWHASTFEDWLARWRGRLGERGVGAAAATTADAMDAVNPLRIPRNHLLEEALAAVEADDIAPVLELAAATRDPYATGGHDARYAQGPPPGFADGFRTFCGT